MDNNQISSLANNPINDSNTNSGTKNAADIQPVTPEGIILSTETPVLAEQNPEIHPELEGNVEKEKANTEQVQIKDDTTKSNVSTISDNTIKTKEPEITHIVNKTTTPSRDHPLETIDRLSILADEDEKDFINNVKAAHEHT